MEEQKKEHQVQPGTPLKVLSTSLGMVLAANLLLIPAVHGETGATPPQAKLVEWSSEEVKKYFDPNQDWSIPLPEAQSKGPEGQPQPSASPGSAASAGGGQSGGGYGGYPVPAYGGGFGWDDLLLYHMIFNNGGSFSSSGWYNQRSVYDSRTNQRYQPRSFDAGTFENKPVAGSSVKPKTSSSTGTFNSKPGSGASSTSGTSGSAGSSSSSGSSKSTSTSPGSIGGKSGGFSSSGGSSSGS